MTHKHHIIPRSIGGTNNHENLVKVTIEEHAEIHRCLWVYGGRWQDELAWKGLSKQIGKEEAQKLICRQAGLLRRGKPAWNTGTKGVMTTNKTSFKKGQTPWNKDKKGLYNQSEESNQKRREKLKGRVSPTTGKHWFTDGRINIVQSVCPPGFTKGRI